MEIGSRPTTDAMNGIRASRTRRMCRYRLTPPILAQSPDVPRGDIARRLEALERAQHLGQGVLGVAEQERRLGVVQQLVLDAGEAGAHRPLEEHHLLRV